MFKAIKNLFKRNKPEDDILDLKFEVVQDISYENEVVKSN